MLRDNLINPFVQTFFTSFCVYFVLNQPFVTNPGLDLSLSFLIISRIRRFELQLRHPCNEHAFCFISQPFNRGIRRVQKLSLWGAAPQR